MANHSWKTADYGGLKRQTAARRLRAYSRTGSYPVYKSFRTTFLIRNSINYFIINVQRRQFLESALRFREENVVLQVNQVNLIYT
jgi:hypothetical protein